MFLYLFIIVFSLSYARILIFFDTEENICEWFPGFEVHRLQQNIGDFRSCSSCSLGLGVIL